MHCSHDNWLYMSCSFIPNCAMDTMCSVSCPLVLGASVSQHTSCSMEQMCNTSCQNGANAQHVLPNGANVQHILPHGANKQHILPNEHISCPVEPMSNSDAHWNRPNLCQYMQSYATLFLIFFCVKYCVIFVANPKISAHLAATDL